MSLSDELQQADALAEALAQAGVREGDRVAVHDLTSPLILRSLYAASVLGAVLVPLNFRWSVEDCQVVLEDAGAKVVIEGEDAPSDLSSLATIVRQPNLETAANRRDVIAHDIAVQMYTSGTTGRPKGVLMSHVNLLGKFVRETNPWNITPDSVVLACMPLFHIGGLGWLLAALTGSADVVVASAAVPDRVLAEVREHEVTHLFLVPAALAALLASGEDVSMPSLTTVVYGASPMESWLLETAMDTWDVDFVQGYGLTETTGQIVSLSGEDHRKWRGRPSPWPVGRPDPGVEVNVQATASADATEQLSEIIVRGPQVTEGYWGIGSLVDEDGWFATGDLGRIDEDGYIFVLDRAKDLIISGGENIMPAEIERLLEDDDSVQEASVIGVASQRWGEVPLALVVPASPGGAVVERLEKLCRASLPGFKRPAGFELVTELPRNAVGKVLKRELRDTWSNWRPANEREAR